jgi:hypothetical protein
MNITKKSCILTLGSAHYICNPFNSILLKIHKTNLTIQFHIFLNVWCNLFLVIFFQMESDHLGYSSYSISVLFADCVGWLPPVNLLIAIRVNFIVIALKFKEHLF